MIPYDRNRIPRNPGGKETNNGPDYQLRYTVAPIVGTNPS